MYAGLAVTVVVPAYRESRLIRRTLDALPAFIDRVIVVDDGSDDDTAERAASWGSDRLTVIRHEENRGVGAAIATGYREALARGADVAVVMAGDAQMDPGDLPALLEPLAQGTADYAKGNRLVFPGVARRMPFLRFLGNHVLSFLTRRATGLGIGDSQCGYTAISGRALTHLDLDAIWPRYGYPNDLLGALATASLRVVDVPVRPIYADETSGIRLHHALFVVPFVLARIVARRARMRLASRGTHAEPARLPSAE